MPLPNLKSSFLGVAKGIGIENTPFGIHTLTLERKGGNLRITDVTLFSNDAEIDEQSRVLRKLIKKNGASHAALSLGPAETSEVVNLIPSVLPAGAPENIVQVQARSIGNFSDEPFIYDFQVMPSLHADKRNVVMSIAKEAVVDECCALVRSIKLKSKKVFSRVLALATAFCSLQPASAYLHTPQVILEIEEEMTAIAIVSNGSVMYANWLMFGIRNLSAENAFEHLQDELKNAITHWRETLPPEDAQLHLKDVWVAGDETEVTQFLDMLGETLPEANLQLLGVPGDMLASPDNRLHPELVIVMGLALQSLDESQIKIVLLPEREKWLERKNREYPYLVGAAILLGIGVLAWLFGTWQYLNHAVSAAVMESTQLQKCLELIPRMNQLHENMSSQQKRMLPIAEASSRNARYLQALEQWQDAQNSANEEDRSWGVYFSDEFSFEYANADKPEDSPEKPSNPRQTSETGNMFSVDTKPQDSSISSFQLKKVKVEDLNILNSIYIGGIVPMGKSRYKAIKDMQTRLVESGVYVNVDDHVDFLKENFQKLYFAPWQAYLSSNKDVLGSDYSTFFLQLPFREAYINSALLSPASSNKNY